MSSQKITREAIETERKARSETNKSDLLYWTFDKEYPLHSNAGILVAGGAGVGKSYFIYKRLLPIYIKYGGYKTILIASRMGKFDATTASELDSDIYKDVYVEFIKMDESYEICQRIRANVIINEFLEKLMHIKKDKDLMNIKKELTNLMKAAGELSIIKNELLKLHRLFDKFLTITIPEIVDYATLHFNRGSQITFNPIIIVFDDYSGSDEFIKPYSDIHKLIFCRRHLHLTMVMSVQSLTTISTNIRRNCTEFICFSTLSPKDVKLLSDRIPIQYTYKELLNDFIKISQEDNRDQKIITIFTVFPNHKVIIGLPQRMLHADI